MAKRHDEGEGEEASIAKRSRRESIEVLGLGKVWGFSAGTRVEDALVHISSRKPLQHARLAIVAEKEGSSVPEFHAELLEGYKYCLVTLGSYKPETKPLRYFGAGYAVDREGFYFVEPDVDEFLQDLKSGKYCVLCGRRQSGKTTTAKVVIERLRLEGDLCPVFLQGLHISAKIWDTSQMWAHLWDCLHRSCPSLFKERPKAAQICPSSDFSDLFEKSSLEVPVTVIMDEADSLLLLSADCLDDFFHTIRKMKQHRDLYNLTSFALIGVETVKDLLEARYKHRYAQANGAYCPSSTPTPLSPFPHDHTIIPSNFDVANIIDLLQQADKEHFGILNDIPQIAASIMEQTAGHKGLVGTCLALLMQEHAYDYKGWLELSDLYKLGTYVFGQATYSRMMQCFRQWVDASQDGFNLLVRFLEIGEQVYVEADLLMIRSLLAEGVLAIKDRRGGTCFVDISSPLLRTAIMRKCVITDQVVDRPLTTTYVDRKWVILQAIKTLDGDLMSRPECLNSEGVSSSEYIHQFLFMCRVKAILCQAYPHIQCFVLPEAKEQQVPGERRSQLRLDTLVRDGPNCARMGFELVVDASLKSAQNHERRAEMYHRQHSAQVFMINFTKDKTAVLIEPKSDGVYSMAVEFSSAENTALVRWLDVNGHLEEDKVPLTKWTGQLSFQDLV